MELRVGLAVVGNKGYFFLEDFLKLHKVAQIFTYEQKASDFSVKDFKALARQGEAHLVVGQRPIFRNYELDLIFAIGWQYLFAEYPGTVVVLHDSLLPRYRGFAPTVAALMAGDTRIGVTAIRPSPSFDEGPIIDQVQIEIASPISIGEAFTALRSAYTTLAKRICSIVASGNKLPGTKQDERIACYSLWLDQFDYALDWSKSADVLQRQILAQGPPYAGSVSATFDGVLFRFSDPQLLADLKIANRVAGKVWRLDGDRVEVVCGSGILGVLPTTPDVPAKPHSLSLRTRFAPHDVTCLFLATRRMPAGDR